VNPWRKLLRTILAVALAAYCFLDVACTSRIPNRVTTEEMDLYREWLKHQFANQPPEQLYVDDQTFVFDPVRNKCDAALRRTDGVSKALIKQLHALGNADYPLDVESNQLKLPWPYRVLDPRKVPPATPGKLHIISFSRVAFSGDHSQALFAVGDSCGGECGGGGPMLANKHGNVWQFRRLESCAWID